MFIGSLLLSLSDLERVQGRLKEAEPILVQALRHLGAVKSQRPDMYCRGQLSLANLRMVQGRFEEAESELCQVFETLRPASHPVRVWGMARLAVTLCFLNKLTEAEDLARQAISLGTPQISRGNFIGCILLVSVAEVEQRLGHPAQAEVIARRALNLYEKFITKPNNPLLFTYLNALAESARLVGKLEEAEALCLRSQALIEGAFGPEHFGLDACLSTLARIRMTQNRIGEAQQLFDRCVAILEKNVVLDHPDLLVRQNEAAPSVTATQAIS
jgi:tetratricopeptide (TPR) repeat protein